MEVVACGLGPLCRYEFGLFCLACFALTRGIMIVVVLELETNQVIVVAGCIHPVQVAFFFPWHKISFDVVTRHWKDPQVFFKG